MPLVTNKNFFSPIQAEFHIRRLPNVTFFCQKVEIPGLEFGHTPEQPTPFSAIPVPGDHLQFNELVVTFKIDEDMANYLEIYEWIVRNGFPTDYEEYRRNATSRWSGEGTTSDGTVLFLNSKSIPKILCEVVDLFPVKLSNVVVDTTMEDVAYLTATVDFRYTYYQIKPVTDADGAP